VTLKDIANEELYNTPFTGILLADDNGLIVGCNNKMLAMTGFSNSDIEGGHITDFVHADYFESLYSSCKHMTGQSRNESGVFLKFLKSNDDYLDCLATTFNVNDNNGNIVGHILFFEKYSGESLNKSYVDDDGNVKWVAIHDKDQKEEFLCNIFHGIQDAILIFDVSGNIVSYNMKILELLDVDMEYMVNVGNFKNLSSDELSMKIVTKFLTDAFAGKDQFFTWMLKKPSDSSSIDVEIHFTKIYKMGNEVVLATIRDVTDKKRIEDQLVNSEKRYRQLVEHSPDGIVIHRDGIVKYVNPAGALILGGKRAEDILGMPVIEFFTEEKREVLKERLKELYQFQRSMPLMEGEMVRIDGNIINVEFAAMPFDMDGKTAVQVVIRDITEKKKQDSYIRYLAMHDTLTGLPNRDLLSDRVAKATERRKRDELKNAVIYLDLDGFKPVNDTLGHAAGDDALREIATRLEASIRGSDTAARIGGDEFVVLLEGVSGYDEINVIATRILDGINVPLTVSGHTFYVGASMGISVYPDDSTEHDELMANADKAMYHVKDTGKNRYVFYSETFPNKAK